MAVSIPDFIFQSISDRDDPLIAVAKTMSFLRRKTNSFAPRISEPFTYIFRYYYPIASVKQAANVDRNPVPLMEDQKYDSELDLLLAELGIYGLFNSVLGFYSRNCQSSDGLEILKLYFQEFVNRLSVKNKPMGCRHRCDECYSVFDTDERDSCILCGLRPALPYLLEMCKCNNCSVPYDKDCVAFCTECGQQNEYSTGKSSLTGPAEEYKKIDLEMVNEIFLKIFNELEMPSKFLEETLFFIWNKSYRPEGRRFKDVFVLPLKNSNSDAASMYSIRSVYADALENSFIGRDLSVEGGFDSNLYPLLKQYGPIELIRMVYDFIRKEFDIFLEDKILIMKYLYYLDDLAGFGQTSVAHEDFTGFRKNCISCGAFSVRNAAKHCSGCGILRYSANSLVGKRKRRQ